MTDKELETFFDTLIDDEGVDRTFKFRILSMGKNEIERLHDPQILIGNDSTKTRSSGDSYLTMKDLPSDFRNMIELYVGTQRYTAIPYVKRILFKNAALRFYIDHKNKKFAITGTGGTSETINQFYLVKTDDPTPATADDGDTTITWPSEFHELAAFKGAELIQSTVDGDSINFRISASQKEFYETLLDSFISWDHDLKLADMDNRGGFEPEEPDIEQDLALM